MFNPSKEGGKTDVLPLDTAGQLNITGFVGCEVSVHSVGGLNEADVVTESDEVHEGRNDDVPWCCGRREGKRISCVGCLAVPCRSDVRFQSSETHQIRRRGNYGTYIASVPTCWGEWAPVRDRAPSVLRSRDVRLALVTAGNWNDSIAIFVQRADVRDRHDWFSSGMLAEMEP